MENVKTVLDVQRDRDALWASEINRARGVARAIIQIEGAGPWSRTELIDEVIDQTDVSRSAAALVQDELIADAVLQARDWKLFFSAEEFTTVYGPHTL